ncbi:MAG TPA: pirin family protein [Steroidobacteraceae bacterium]|nr:pirin family protein [Steroidobacteraceae bacterium]
MTSRTVERVLTGRPASDGGGVRLTRVISPEQTLDPFLLLDEFDSSRAGDYIAGFPSHPHRGFETVTYMLDGHMLHEDHLGNRGDLTAGAVQWMTAGRGIIHSEMPQQTHGRMRGFQLWINLPAAAKMRPATYQDLAPERIPSVELPGVRVRVVAGTFEPLAPPARPVAGPVGGGATAPLYLDVAVDPNASLTLATPAGHRLLVYAFDGTPGVGGQILNKGQLAILTPGTTLELRGGAGRVLVLGGKPLGEPIVHYGPFVMNSVAEIEQAIRDYQSGTLTAAA